MSKNVALVLSSGGARGIAHIGVIEELQRRGYTITSVSGTSMGALIGGMYAADYLTTYRSWLATLTRMKVFNLMDFTLSTRGLVKGDKVLDTMQLQMPDINIEELNIPFRAVSTDLLHHKEIVFDKGSLYKAIRASISIPSMLKPVLIGDAVCVDGGIINPLPLSCVPRSEGDILVAVGVCAKIAKAR